MADSGELGQLVTALRDAYVNGNRSREVGVLLPDAADAIEALQADLARHHERAMAAFDEAVQPELDALRAEIERLRSELEAWKRDASDAMATARPALLHAPDPRGCVYGPVNGPTNEGEQPQ